MLRLADYAYLELKKASDMPTLKSLFEKQQLGFTVYSPDCAQSRLWGNLDYAIQNATGFQAVSRRWINHDFNSIMRFYRSDDPNETEPPPEQNPEEAARKYETVPVEQLQYGHLMVRLLLSGPALLTLWHGENAVETLLTIKGATHPPLAAPQSIRGSFWCDNGVCNLMHVSDNEAEAERELKTVNLWHLMNDEMTIVPLLDPIPPPTHYVAHSGIVVLCDLVNRLLTTIPKAQKMIVNLPPSGNAKETNAHLTELLQSARHQTDAIQITELIDAYLAGNVVSVTGLLKQMPVTKWEHFIIQCGAIKRYKWNTA